MFKSIYLIHLKNKGSIKIDLKLIICLKIKYNDKRY